MRQALTTAVLAALSLFAVCSLRAVSAGTAIQLDIPGLVREADLAFEGRVLAAHVQRDARGRIETEYTLAVTRTYLGPALALRVFRLPGGVMPDGSGLVLPGMPSIEVGEEALLFLSQPGSTGVRMPVGLAQGKFRIVRDVQGAVSLVRNASDLVIVDPASGAVTSGIASKALDYKATARAIETAVAAKVARK
jgi:hypothetical protein